MSSPRTELDSPVKYGDIFPVKGDLAGEPIRPGDASIMQAAEGIVTGKTQKGGAASFMQSATAVNERAGFVAHGDLTPVGGVSVTRTDVPGLSTVRESVAGQTVAEFAVPPAMPESAAAEGGDAVAVQAVQVTAVGKESHDNAGQCDGKNGGG